MIESGSECPCLVASPWNAPALLVVTLARRRNPEKMAEYNAEVVERRREQQMRKAELKAVQKDTSGADTLEAWKALKDEGKVLSSDDMSRDTDTNVLGSKDGLIAERIDENLPYIDQGYVSEDAGPDLSKALGDARTAAVRAAGLRRWRSCALGRALVIKSSREDV